MPLAVSMSLDSALRSPALGALVLALCAPPAHTHAPARRGTHASIHSHMGTLMLTASTYIHAHAWRALGNNNIIIIVIIIIILKTSVLPRQRWLPIAANLAPSVADPHHQREKGSEERESKGSRGRV